jgi:hypothetical protein
MSSRQLAPVLKDIPSVQTAAVKAETRGGSPSEDCARIRELGYKLSGRANLYGEKFEIVSDPFPEGGGVAVRVVTATNRAIRTLRLPVAILLGLSRFSPKRPIIEPRFDPVPSTSS